MKIFKKIRRIIFQYFETEFWYRWRTVSKPNAEIKRKAFENLNDTWNGDFSILNIIDDKVTHMLHNLRKYGNCAKLYILPSDIAEHGIEKDIQFAWNKALEDEKDPKLYLGSISVNKQESDSEYRRFYLEKENDWNIVSYDEEEIPFEKIPKNKRMRTFIGYKNGEILTDWAKEYKQIHKTYIAKIKNIYDYHAIQISLNNSNISLNILKDGFFAISTLHLEPEEIKLISKDLYSYAQGLRPTLKQLWEFRRKIRKLRDLDDTDFYDLDKNYSKEEYQEIYKKFETYKKEMVYEIADYWIKYASGWWD